VLDDPSTAPPLEAPPQPFWEEFGATLLDWALLPVIVVRVPRGKGPPIKTGCVAARHSHR
jgi:hypothetical protein